MTSASRTQEVRLGRIIGPFRGFDISALSRKQRSNSNSQYR